MKILITGGSGQVGGFIVEFLAQKHEIEVLDIAKPKNENLPYHPVDILDLPALMQTLAGFDAVVHLAAIPLPLHEPPKKVFEVNALGTFNVLEACAYHKIPRFVYISSESTLGFVFADAKMHPDYFPIDEDHRLRPQDSYGMSKLTGEILCRGYSARTGMKTVCLRPPWIWVPLKTEILFYQQLVAKYQNWSKNLWAYVHVFDLARAIELALNYNENDNFNTFYITADDNWVNKNSRQLIAQFFPDVVEIAGTFGSTDSLISSEKAKVYLGYKPHYSWYDILPDES